MKKNHIHVMRLLFVLLMVFFTTVWGLKFQEDEKAAEESFELPVESLVSVSPELMDNLSA